MYFPSFGHAHGRLAMVRVVQAIRDEGRVGKGVSGSHFFVCDDGKEYIVKFAAPAPDKTVVNELVGGSLALLYNLPTPEIVLVGISSDIITLSDDLRKRGIREGMHLGVERLPRDSWDFDTLPSDFISRNTLVNPDQIYGVVTFDNWLLNNDRDNTGNNMLQLLPRNQMRYIMVDFGHCFTGNAWNEGLAATENNQGLMRVFRFLRTYITRLTNFEGWFRSLEDFSEAEIDSIVSAVPQSWSLSSREKEVLLHLIKHRKYLPRSIIIANRGVFGI
jgi:hypothetical protein